MKELNDAALRCRFRSLLYELGYDCFVVLGYRDQTPFPLWQYRGEADKELLENLVRKTADGLDMIEDGEWHDSEGYE